MKFLLISFLSIIASCNSSTSADFDFCKYATKNSDYSFFFKGDVIDKCDVKEPKSKSIDEGGYKSINHSATLELSIKNSSGEVRVNKRWIQVMGDGVEFTVLQNKTIQ